MTKNRNRKQDTHAASAESGSKYTTALRARSAAQAAVSPWPAFEPGMRIRFAEDRQSFTVQAVSRNGRYVVCTRPFNLQRTVFYTVMDLAKGIRGRDNRVFSPGYETREQCVDAAAAFEAADIYKHLRETGQYHDWYDTEWLRKNPELLSRDGVAHPTDTEISYRNWVWIRLQDIQTDPRTVGLIPALRALVAAAPPRNYNDHNPRTCAELDAWMSDSADPAAG